MAIPFLAFFASGLGGAVYWFLHRHLFCPFSLRNWLNVNHSDFMRGEILHVFPAPFCLFFCPKCFAAHHPTLFCGVECLQCEAVCMIFAFNHFVALSLYLLTLPVPLHVSHLYGPKLPPVDRLILYSPLPMQP